jgi:cardiolipin synthase
MSPTVESVVHRTIDRAGATRPIPGNRVQLLQDGPETYQAMLALIAEAKSFIHFENYIIRQDETGRRFAEALAARAREGVAVRVLYDWLGCIGTRRRLWRQLRTAGCEVRAFNPPTPFHPLRSVSRDHRKLVVVDGTRAVIGGLCIGDEWAGNPDRGIPPWRDTAVLIEGPAAQALDLAFARVWQQSGDPLPDEESATDAPVSGTAVVRIIAGEPGRERAFRVIEYLAAGCRRRLWITDAYLVPPPRLFEVLVQAERDGVDIRILVPGMSDVPLVRNITRLGYRDLLRAGFRIFEWKGPMIHAKSLVADGRWTRIGTSNINLSSLVGNYELDVLIDDEQLGHAMEAQFRRDMAGSAEVVREVRHSRGPLKRILPSRLQEHGGEEGVVRRGKREIRQRTVVAARRLMSGAFRSLVGPIVLALAVMGVLFLGLPTLMGYVAGGVLLILALVFGVQVWQRTW